MWTRSFWVTWISGLARARYPEGVVLRHDLEITPALRHQQDAGLTTAESASATVTKVVRDRPDWACSDTKPSIR